MRWKWRIGLSVVLFGLIGIIIVSPLRWRVEELVLANRYHRFACDAIPASAKLTEWLTTNEATLSRLDRHILLVTISTDARCTKQSVIEIHHGGTQDRKAILEVLGPQDDLPVPVNFINV